MRAAHRAMHARHMYLTEWANLVPTGTARELAPAAARERPPSPRRPTPTLSTAATGWPADVDRVEETEDRRVTHRFDAWSPPPRGASIASRAPPPATHRAQAERCRRLTTRPDEGARPATPTGRSG